MRCDPQRVGVAAAQACGLGGNFEAAADPAGADAGAAQGEQEVSGPAIAGVRQAALAAALGHPSVKCGQGLLVERDDPFGGELAERDLEPGAVSGQVPEAVQFEVE